MIFISVGTQKFQFNRLLKYIDEEIKKEKLKEEVFAQIGNSDYLPKNYKYKKFLSREEFNQYIEKAKIVICHAGVGTIMLALNLNKKVIVVPRLQKYKEHVDNHQIEIANAFAKKNLIVSNGENINELINNIQNINYIKLDKYESSNKKIQDMIDNFIIDNTKLKVLMIGSNYKKVKGGIVSVIRNYMNYKKWNDVEIKFIPTHIDAAKIIKLIYFIVALIRIDFSILTGKYDVLHIHISERGSIFRKNLVIKHARFLSKKIRIVLHHHGAEFDDEYKKMTEKNQKQVNKMLENVDVNIVLSNKLINSIKNKNDKAKVEVLYNAVKTYKENLYNDKSNKILFLGRLGERKGVYDLLEVLKQIKEDLKTFNIKVSLCGDGEIETVEKKVKEFGLEDIICHIGWIYDNEKEKIFSDTLINVLPSYNEGLPMSILETMGYGIPNISTNVASIPEVINEGITGYLITPGDKENLKEDILMLIKDEKLRNKISQNSFELIKKKFSLDENVNKLKRIYWGKN